MKTRIKLNTVESDKKGMAEKLGMSTAEIGLTVRTTNCLEERGIFTVEDLLNSTRDELLGISNFGEKTLEEVYQGAGGIGFCRRPRSEPSCTAEEVADSALTIAGPVKTGAMPTLAVGMRNVGKYRHMPTASVGMAPDPSSVADR